MKKTLRDVGTCRSRYLLDTRLLKLRDRAEQILRQGRRSVSPGWHSSDTSGATPGNGDISFTALDGPVETSCRVDSGEECPWREQMPSRIGVYESTVANWAADYIYFLEHTFVEVHPHERIIGEFHWQLDEARDTPWPDAVLAKKETARQLGAYGHSRAHTCPDLAIGLKLGWSGMLDKVRFHRRKFQLHGNEAGEKYLAAQLEIIQAIIHFIYRHADYARKQAESEKDPQLRDNYAVGAATCEYIAERRPETLQHALQWIHFYRIAERIQGHGNGYGRLDMLLGDFFAGDMAGGRISRDEARDLLAEFYLKYGPCASLGGRDANLKDASSDFSRLCLEAYDMIGGAQTSLSLMWHEGIDPELFAYACDIIGRHGRGVPALWNYDQMRASELAAGYDEEEAWNTGTCGGQWFAVPGSEYSDQGTNCLVLAVPMQHAIAEAVEQDVEDFELFWQIFRRHLDRAAGALCDFKNAVFDCQSRLWPEMVTSLCMHGPIERGRDVTEPRAVDYGFTSVSIVGLGCVADSLYAIEQAVFARKLFTLEEVHRACQTDWLGREQMRRVLANLPKFGNDSDDVDAFAVRVASATREILDGRKTIKGFSLRASFAVPLWPFNTEVQLPATPDGRHQGEPIPTGNNPMPGRVETGLSAAVNSVCKIDSSRFGGGAYRVILPPSFFSSNMDRKLLVSALAKSFFQQSLMQAEIRMIDPETLYDEMADSSGGEMGDASLKVSGYATRSSVSRRQLGQNISKRIKFEEM